MMSTTGQGTRPSLGKKEKNKHCDFFDRVCDVLTEMRTPWSRSPYVMFTYCAMTTAALHATYRTLYMRLRQPL